jgi:SAM-dependent methyltransferase
VKTYLHAAFAELRRARGANQSLSASWDRFRNLVQEHADAPPFVASDVMKQLEIARRNRPVEEIQILDHGCGGGFVLLYLLARGYTGIHGVDIETNAGDPMWNMLLKEVFGIEEARFQRYDGQKLPFLDASFDFVFSNQVIEHIEERYWQSYFDEEARVLKPGGCVFHEAPHRLGPYESHTRTWFLHYLPRRVHGAIYSAMGRGSPQSHYLRLPQTIRRTLGETIGPTQDLTAASFVEATAALKRAGPSAFDGPTQVRHVAEWFCRLPLLGGIFRTVIGRLAMLRLMAEKPNGR